MDQGTKTIGEHLSTLRVHWAQILLVTVPLAALALLIAHALPPIYRSSATILVQEQEIPPDLVKSTITSFADERIQVISQQVMTRASLLKLANKHGLYEDRRDRMTDEEIVEHMRKSIKLTTVDASVSDRRSGRRDNATIAFRIAYESPRPDQAQKVVDELVTLYLSENAKVRQEGIAKTTQFLSQEAERIAKQIQDIEANLAAFKQRNADRLPETAGATTQLTERNQTELARVERDISLAQDRKISLEGQLALLDPRLPPPVTSNSTGERVLTPEQKLRALEAQYASQAALYHDEHPDIRRLKREITALKADIATGERDPDAPADKAPAGRPGSNTKPDNPAYTALASQIEIAKREIVQLTSFREELRARQRKYDARLLAMPELEREYRDLTRDYDNAQARYRDIKAKLMQAEVAQELEKDRKAERFTLGEPASLPRSPVRPDRPRIALMGVAGSLGAGLGIAFLRDALDASIKGPGQLARIARLPILTPIPYIRTRRERTGRRTRALVLSALAASAVTLALVGLYVLFKAQPQVLEAVANSLPL